MGEGDTAPRGAALGRHQKWKLGSTSVLLLGSEGATTCGLVVELFSWHLGLATKVVLVAAFLKIQLG